MIPLPVYVSAVGDLHTKLGKAKEAEKQYTLVEYIAALSFLSKNVYNRELALFYADHEIPSGDCRGACATGIRGAS